MRPRGSVDPLNVPRPIAAAVSSKLATLAELDTVYGSQDLWDLLEIHAVDVHNQRMAQKEAERSWQR